MFNKVGGVRRTQQNEEPCKGLLELHKYLNIDEKKYPKMHIKFVILLKKTFVY